MLRGPALPTFSQATLTLLLDHLRLVSSFHVHNRMTPQNLAVCFGPVLLPARQASARPRTRSSGSGVANAVDFKRHIEVLHYLLQAWPGERAPSPRSQYWLGRRRDAFLGSQSESRTSGKLRPQQNKRTWLPRKPDSANPRLLWPEAPPLNMSIRGPIA